MGKRHQRSSANKESRRVFGLPLAAALAVLAIACNPAADSAPTTTPTINTSSSQTGAAPNVVGISVVEADRGYGEVGGWWHIAHSTLVVRGTLTGVQREFKIGDQGYVTWGLNVSEVLAGSADSHQLEVVHYPASEIRTGSHAGQTEWKEGDEGIFFLRQRFGDFDLALPDLYVPNLGSLGILREDLEYWSAFIVRAAPALGSMRRLATHDVSPAVAAARTGMVLDGTIEHISEPRSVLGWQYVEVTVGESELVWDNIGPAEFEPDWPSIVVVFALDEANSLTEGQRVRLALGQTALPNPIGTIWMVIKGTETMADLNRNREQVREDFEVLYDELLATIAAAHASAIGLLSPLAAEAGRIPIPGQTEEVDDPDPQPDYDILFRTPIIVATDSVTVTFDKWFFSTLDGTGRVTITQSNGTLLLEGPVEGPESVMRENLDTTFDFIDESGQVVATITQDQFQAAIQFVFEAHIESRR